MHVFFLMTSNISKICFIIFSTQSTKASKLGLRKYYVSDYKKTIIYDTIKSNCPSTITPLGHQCYNLNYR